MAPGSSYTYKLYTKNYRIVDLSPKYSLKLFGKHFTQQTLIFYSSKPLKTYRNCTPKTRLLKMVV